MITPLKLTGIAIAPTHQEAFIRDLPNIAWVELNTEDYCTYDYANYTQLEKIRQHYPFSFHGRSLSLASVDELNWPYLKKIAELIHTYQPALISDHLSWCSYQGQYFHQPLPFPFTEEALLHVAHRIEQIQHFLKQTIVIENIPNDIKFIDNQLSESVFLAEISKMTGCGLLLNIDNMEKTSRFFNMDANQYLSDIHSCLIKAIHISDATNWALYQKAIAYYNIKPTIIKGNNQSLQQLITIAREAENMMRDAYVTIKRAG